MADALALQEQNRYAESIEPLRALLRESPDDPELNFRLGLALLAEKQFGMAVWPLRRAADSPAYAVQAGLELAWAAHRNGTYDDAINAATGVLEHESENLSALLVRGRSHLRANREELALADFERMESIDPDVPDMWMSRALTLARLGRVEEAAERIAEIRERVGKEAAFADPLVCTLEAVFTHESGDVKGGEQLHEGCLRDHPETPVVVQHAVEFYDKTGRPERGTAILLETLASEPKRSDVRNRISGRLRGAGAIAQAEQILREGTAIDLGPAPWIALALHFEALRQPVSAREAMAKGLERMPAAVPPDLRFAYADICIRAGDYDEALAQIRHLPWPGYASMIRGRIAFEQGDYKVAFHEFEQAIDDQPANPGLRQLAGQAAEQLGEFDFAISHYREAIRTNQPGVEAGLNLAYLQEAVGNLQAAFTTISIHQKLNPNDLEGYRLGISLSTRLGREQATTSQLARIQALAGPGEVAAVRAAIALEAGDANTAAKIVEDADLAPADTAHRSAVRVLVRALLQSGQDGQARQLLDPLVRENPTDAELLAMSAQALEQSDPEEAWTTYMRVLELDPNETAALFGSARLAAKRGATTEALGYSDRLLEVDPSHDDAAWHAIALAKDAGDAANHEFRLRARLRANPHDGEAALALARVVRASDPEETRLLANRAARLRSGPEAGDVLAEALLALGQPAKAIQVLKHILDSHPDRSGTRYRLGLAHLAANQREPAVAAFEQSLSGTPFEEAEKARQHLSALAGETQN